jgi:hypothetical protein
MWRKKTYRGRKIGKRLEDRRNINWKFKLRVQLIQKGTNKPKGVREENFKIQLVGGKIASSEGGYLVSTNL